MKTYTARQIFLNLECANDLMDKNEFCVYVYVRIEGVLKGTFIEYSEGKYFNWLDFKKHFKNEYTQDVIELAINGEYGRIDKNTYLAPKIGMEVEIQILRN